MALDYTVLPLTEERIQAAYGNGNEDTYLENIAKYGIERVRNNYLINVVLLQEEKDVWDADGRKIDITRPLIEKVFYATNKAYDKWYNAPINALKTFMRSSDYLGYVPIQTDHPEKIEGKHGYIVGGSLKLIELEGKLHLIGKMVLISPESKLNWATGLWREISPGINADYTLREVSFVALPAQMNNSTFADGKPELNTDNKDVAVSTITQFDIELQELKLKAKQEKLNNEIANKEFVSEKITEELILKGIIPSSKRKTLQGYLLQLSSGHAPLVADMLGKVTSGKNPLANKPRTFLLRGATDMGTKEERFSEFQKTHGAGFKTAVEMLDAFEKEESTYQEQLRLASGKAGLEATGADKYKELLSLLEKDEEVDAEIKSQFIELCKSKFGMSLSQPGTVDAGGVAQPNNASNLSNGAPGITDNSATAYNEMLEKGYNTMKTEITNLTAKYTELETKYNNVKSAFEGAK